MLGVLDRWTRTVKYITDTNSANQFPYRAVSHRSKILYKPIYHSPSIWPSGLRDSLFKKQMSTARDQFEPQVRGWVNI